MSVAKAIVTKSKLDTLANTVAAKARVSAPMTIDEMVAAVGSIDTSGSAVLQTKSVDPMQVVQIVLPDTGYDGLSQVNISAIQTSSLTANANGQYSPPVGSYYSSVTVDVEDSAVNLQTKTITPAATPISVTPDSGYQGLSSVTVNAIPSNYSDVSGVTAVAGDVIAGQTFVDASGVLRTGTLRVSSYYVGSEPPSADLGDDGDLYLQI